MRSADAIVVLLLLVSIAPSAGAASAWLCVDVPPPIVCTRVEERVEAAVEAVTHPELPDLDPPDVPDIPDAPDTPGLDEVEVPDGPSPEEVVPEELPLVPGSPDELDLCERLPVYVPLAVHPLVMELIRQSGIGTLPPAVRDLIEDLSHPRERCHEL